MVKILDGKLPGVKLIEPDVLEDGRGFFMESYSKKRFEEQGLQADFVQDNHSLSRQAGVLRGLHYQLNPYAQMKLVRVIAGVIWDIVVDVRAGSPTYGQWEGFTLSAVNKRQLLVPRGFAHGFCTLAADTEVLYKVDGPYSPAHDRGIIWNDPALAIAWPVAQPILSAKDASHPVMAAAELNFIYESMKG